MAFYVFVKLKSLRRLVCSSNCDCSIIPDTAAVGVYLPGQLPQVGVPAHDGETLHPPDLPLPHIADAVVHLHLGVGTLDPPAMFVYP